MNSDAANPRTEEGHGPPDSPWWVGPLGHVAEEIIGSAAPTKVVRHVRNCVRHMGKHDRPAAWAHVANVCERAEYRATAAKAWTMAARLCVSEAYRCSQESEAVADISADQLGTEVHGAALDAHALRDLLNAAFSATLARRLGIQRAEKGA